MTRANSISAIAGLAATALSFLTPSAGLAQAFPNRPVTVVVPYGAGGAGDAIIRLLATVMEKRMGQALIVESRPGGGGTVGARHVANAQPDGHTLLLGATNNFVINQYMFPKQNLDPFHAFALITKVADVPSVLYAPVALDVSTLADFIKAAKAAQGKFSYASPSVGTVPHLAVERLAQMTGAEIVHVPFKGAPPAMQALLRNDVQLYLAGWGLGRELVEAKKIRALAVASPARIPGIPLPTASESGVKGFIAGNWWGLAAPRETPPTILERLHAEVNFALQDKTINARLKAMGFVPGGQSPQVFTSEAKAEAEAWKKTIETGKLAVQ